MRARSAFTLAHFLPAEHTHTYTQAEPQRQRKKHQARVIKFIWLLLKIFSGKFNAKVDLLRSLSLAERERESDCTCIYTQRNNLAAPLHPSISRAGALCVHAYNGVAQIFKYRLLISGWLLGWLGGWRTQSFWSFSNRGLVNFITRVRERAGASLSLFRPLRQLFIMCQHFQVGITLARAVRTRCPKTKWRRECFSALSLTGVCSAGVLISFCCSTHEFWIWFWHVEIC